MSHAVCQGERDRPAASHARESIHTQRMTVGTINARYDSDSDDTDLLSLPRSTYHTEESSGLMVPFYKGALFAQARLLEVAATSQGKLICTAAAYLSISSKSNRQQ